VLTNVVFAICDNLPKIQFKKVNNTSVFSLNWRWITNYASTWSLLTIFGSSDEHISM